VAQQPQDLLDYAIKLLRTAGSHLEYKVVIEQAYYGAYHAALQFEEALPHRSTANTGGSGSHEALFQRLQRPNSKLDYGLQVISKDVAVQMKMLKPLRELATYELQETLTVDQAEQVIAGAKDVVAECAKGKRKLASSGAK
jgi:hypothetical protein